MVYEFTSVHRTFMAIELIKKKRGEIEFRDEMKQQQWIWWLEIVNRIKKDKKVCIYCIYILFSVRCDHDHMW